MEYRLVKNDELYHYGVPGMRWGHRKAVPDSYASSKARYKAAKRAFNRSHSRAYNYADRLWEQAKKDGKNFNAAQKEYKREKARTADQRSAIRKERVKTAAKVGAAVGATALAVYGGHKYKTLKNEMGEMNRKIEFGKQMTEQLYRESMGVGSNPLLFSRVSYQGNDFKFHDAVKNVSGYHNYDVDKQQVFNTVRDYARAKKRYTGHY